MAYKKLNDSAEIAELIIEESFLEAIAKSLPIEQILGVPDWAVADNSFRKLLQRTSREDIFREFQLRLDKKRGWKANDLLAFFAKDDPVTEARFNLDWRKKIIGIIRNG